MKNTEVKQRQNEIEAIELLKASKRCLRHERGLTYFMIILSFGICLVAIINRYINFGMVGNIESSAFINLISGAILVASIPINFYSSRMHTEGTVLQDRFESFVFNNATNASILRPISMIHVQRYARGMLGANKKYYNSIYKSNDNINDETAQYEYIKREVTTDYDLYLAVQPFFMTIWIGFMVLIIIIAISFDSSFVMTLINILIPSLSAISTIFSSWHSNQLQMRQLTNLIGIIDQIESLSQEKKKAYITNKANMRLLADGLFNYRSSSFIIPEFLVLIHNYSQKKKKEAEEAERAALDEQQKSRPTTAQKHTTIVVPNSGNKTKDLVLKKPEPAKTSIKVQDTKPQAKTQDIKVSTKIQDTAKAKTQTPQKTTSKK